MEGTSKNFQQEEALKNLCYDILENINRVHKRELVS